MRNFLDKFGAEILIGFIILLILFIIVFSYIRSGWNDTSIDISIPSVKNAAINGGDVNITTPIKVTMKNNNISSSFNGVKIKLLNSDDVLLAESSNELLAKDFKFENNVVIIDDVLTWNLDGIKFLLNGVSGKTQELKYSIKVKIKGIIPKTLEGSDIL